MKVEGTMGVVFWALVGLLVGTALGFVWHLTELTLFAAGGLAGTVIFGLHDYRSNSSNADKDRVALPITATPGDPLT